MKLNFKKPKFIINGKCVICKLGFYLHTDTSKLFDRIHYKLIESSEIVHTCFYQSMDGEATGKALCKDGDVFDIEIGKRIAERKARVKIHKAVQRKVNQIRGEYIKNLNEIEEFLLDDIPILNNEQEQVRLLQESKIIFK